MRGALGGGIQNQTGAQEDGGDSRKMAGEPRKNLHRAIRFRGEGSDQRLSPDKCCQQFDRNVEVPRLRWLIPHVRIVGFDQVDQIGKINRQSMKKMDCGDRHCCPRIEIPWIWAPRAIEWCVIPSSFKVSHARSLFRVRTRQRGLKEQDASGVLVNPFNDETFADEEMKFVVDQVIARRNSNSSQR